MNARPFLRFIGLTAMLGIGAAPLFLHAADPPANPAAWMEPMKKVHARFTGTPGTFAQFGDSITVTMAFWTPLEAAPKNMDAETAKSHQLVKSYMNPECWRQWKGPDFGSNGGMTIRWALDNVDNWLAKLNPEAALIMFGSNRLTAMHATISLQKSPADWNPQGFRDLLSGSAGDAYFWPGRHSS